MVAWREFPSHCYVSVQPHICILTWPTLTEACQPCNQNLGALNGHHDLSQAKVKARPVDFLLAMLRHTCCVRCCLAEIGTCLGEADSESASLGNEDTYGGNSSKAI